MCMMCRPDATGIAYDETPTGAEDGSLTSKAYALLNTYLGLPPGSDPYANITAASIAPSAFSPLAAIMGGTGPQTAL